MEFFDPPKYSIEENRFFLDHLGKAPAVVLQESMPEGVNPVAVREVIGEIYELKELEKARGQVWGFFKAPSKDGSKEFIGVEAIEKSIKVYLEDYVRSLEMHKRGAPRFPSMHAWDSRGRPHSRGSGSDANTVSTWIDSDGNRHGFRVELRRLQSEDFTPPWMKDRPEVPDKPVEDLDKGFVQCPLCGWATNFDPDSERGYNLAKARLASHCARTGIDEEEAHREFKLKFFG